MRKFFILAATLLLSSSALAQNATAPQPQQDQSTTAPQTGDTQATAKIA